MGMLIFYRLIVWSFVLLSLVIFYLFNTTLGHQNIKDYLGDYLTNKTSNHIKVSSLNFNQYPHIFATIKLNHTATVELLGEINGEDIDIDYHVKGRSLKVNRLLINDKIDVTGHMKGNLRDMQVKGKGELFGGFGTYTFRSFPRKIEDVQVNFKGVESHKIFEFFHKKPIILGRANIDANFSHLSKHDKVGSFSYSVKKGTIHGLPIQLKNSVAIDGVKHNFFVDINSSVGRLKLEEGSFHQSKKLGKANYTLKIKDLALLKKYTKKEYQGSLHSHGEVIYDNGFIVKGKSQDFGGEIDFIYKNGNIDANLHAVSLVKLLKRFEYPTLLDAKIEGHISYNFNQKSMIINTDLKETRFTRTQMTDMLFSASGIDILKERFDKSSFHGGYQNNQLLADLKIDNGTSHLFLTKIKMNSKTNSVDSYFELIMQGEQFEGEIYGTLEHPRVKLDMKKLMKYQIEKKIGSFLEKEKTQNLKNQINNIDLESIKEKIKAIDIDEVKEGAKSLLKSFF